MDEKKKQAKEEIKHEEEEFKKRHKLDGKEKKKSKKNKIIITLSIVLVFFISIGLLSFFAFPHIKLNGKETEELTLETDYEEKGASANVFGENVSDKIKISGQVDSKKPGTYKITYTIKKYGLTFTKVRTVKVVDKEKPVITLKGEKELTLCPGATYEELGYTASDNYDKDLTSKVKVTKEDNKVIYTVSDSSGNKTTLERALNFTDKEKPKITLKGSTNMQLALNRDYKEPGYDVKDNCDKDLKSSVKVTTDVNKSKIGKYKVTYTVTDKAGNTETVTRNVEVKKITNSGVIYLTFDDGPSSTITAKVLDILRKKDVKATFFVINHSDTLNYLIKREHDEGHTVALHSYTHNYKQVYSSVSNYWADLNKISDKVYKITGVRSKIVRFPGGSSNTVSRRYSKGIMTTLTKQLVDKGYKYYDWNADSEDAGSARNTSDVYKYVTNNLARNRNNIVLMHDYENNYKTLNALSDIIDYGKNNGFTFEAIDASTPMVRHGVNN